MQFLIASCFMQNENARVITFQHVDDNYYSGIGARRIIRKETNPNKNHNVNSIRVNIFYPQSMKTKLFLGNISI